MIFIKQWITTEEVFILKFFLEKIVNTIYENTWKFSTSKNTLNRARLMNMSHSVRIILKFTKKSAFVWENQWVVANAQRCIEVKMNVCDKCRFFPADVKSLHKITPIVDHTLYVAVTTSAKCIGFYVRISDWTQIECARVNNWMIVCDKEITCYFFPPF